MVALARELTMTSEPVRPERLRGDSYGRRNEARDHVRCLLHLGRTVVAIDVPVDAVSDHRRQPEGIQIEIPGQSTEPVQPVRVPSKADLDWSHGWLSEMQSFDRY